MKVCAPLEESINQSTPSPRRPKACALWAPCYLCSTPHAQHCPPCHSTVSIPNHQSTPSLQRPQECALQASPSPAVIAKPPETPNCVTLCQQHRSPIAGHLTAIVAHYALPLSSYQSPDPFYGTLSVIALHINHSPGRGFNSGGCPEYSIRTGERADQTHPVTTRCARSKRLTATQSRSRYDACRGITAHLRRGKQ